MKRNISLLLALIVSSVGAATALAQSDPKSDPKAASPKSSSVSPPKAPDVIAAGKAAFVDVASVLHSPRCQNCHPAGDAPLQTDHAKRHAQNITRASVRAGSVCTTCHQDRNSEAVGVAGGPPGAPDWELPPDDMPMVFEGKTLTALCEQLKNPEANGHKDFAALLDHVDHAPLVLWGWAPGGKRSLPPLSHEKFIAAFKMWIASDGACP